MSATENNVAAACDALARDLRWNVDRIDQRRRTKIVEGIPDRRYHRPGQRVWVELKAPGGKLTQAQYDWLLSELDAGALAAAVDDVAQLQRLFTLLARRSSSMEAAARDYCRDLVRLCWLRGPRREAA